MAKQTGKGKVTDDVSGVTSPMEMTATANGRFSLQLLRPDPNNPRTIMPEAADGLRYSMAEFGDLAGVVWNDATGELVAGHQRLDQLRKAGATTFHREPFIGPGTDTGAGYVQHPITHERFPVRFVAWERRKQQAANLAANSRALAGQFTAGVVDALDGLRQTDGDLFEHLRFSDLLTWEPNATLLLGTDPATTAATAAAAAAVAHGRDAAQRNLQQLFGVPPFSVLDGRQGYWQDRKRAWIALGVDSGAGREHLGVTANASEGKYEYFSGRGAATGGSIFDPVLCEIAVRWFCPPGGAVLDPFAGGSVRGVVAGLLGRHYTGVDLRPGQVDANRVQWEAVAKVAAKAATAAAATIDLLPIDVPPDLTPVQQHGGFSVKRDDLFITAGQRGGKARTCLHLVQQAKALGAVGVVTAGSRQSPQVNIVAGVARSLGLSFRAHVPSGPLTPELTAAQAAGAEIVQHRPGHNSVIVARARDDAQALGWALIPFGMETEEAVRQTAAQVRNLPNDCTRLVVPVGSGMTLAGILHGLQQVGRNLPVLGVQVGAYPGKRLDKFAPDGWRSMAQVVKSAQDYHEPATVQQVGDLRLDPVYEGKCVPFLQPGDCLWVVGIRETAAGDMPDAAVWDAAVPGQGTPENAPKRVGGQSGASVQALGTAGQVCPTWVVGDSRNLPDLVAGEVDLVFSCPPYADLEVYSNDPADLSNAGSYVEFAAAYRIIIANAVAKLRDNRFAVWVVGDIRGKDGRVLPFVTDSIQAFEDAGAYLYNAAVYVTPCGSLPLRARKAFEATRKMGKTHQHVLVFCKGDARKGAEAVGNVQFGVGEASGADEGTTLDYLDGAPDDAPDASDAT